MDLGTLIGFVGGAASVLGAMLMGGHMGAFWSLHGIMIVFVGGFFAAMYTTSLGNFFASFKAMGNAFKAKNFRLDELIEKMTELSNIARKDGMMALEGQGVPDPFFQKGLQMLVDGADEAKLAKSLKAEINAMKARHQEKQDVAKAWVELGPAYGMMGTLIGLVEMMGNMEDTAAIGQGMATALIGTLYGAIAANVLFGPLAQKMKNNTTLEVQYREMVIEGLRAISRGESARNIQDSMVCVLPPVQQLKFQAA